ncbi:MAG: ABC transporter substrate-binding protein [Deltaproteobacteria bacterium]
MIHSRYSNTAHCPYRKGIFAATVACLILLLSPSEAVDFPKRIVSLSPSTTEIIYGVGAWARVVGVTLYADFPPEAATLPKVGGWVDPNIEAIFALKPDLVVMTDTQNQIFGDKLRRIRLNTLSVEGNDSVRDILDSILAIGRALGRERQALALARSVEEEIEAVRAAVLNRKPRRALFVVGRNPGTLEDIYVIGRGSYIDELITIAGGRNVIETKALAVKISRESALSLNPDFIIEVNHEKPDKTAEVVAVWSALTQVAAVKNGRVHVVRSASLLHPSQRITEGARMLAEILHPEAGDKSGGEIQTTKKR